LKQVVDSLSLKFIYWIQSLKTTIRKVYPKENERTWLLFFDIITRFAILTFKITQLTKFKSSNLTQKITRIASFQLASYLPCFYQFQIYCI